MATTSITVEVDEDLKIQAEKLFTGTGLNIEFIFQLFLKQVVREQQIPRAIFSELGREGSAGVMEEVEKGKQEFYQKESMDVNVEGMIASAEPRLYSTGVYRV